MRTRALLIYDGDCGFCTRAVALLRRRIRPDCDAEPWQFTDLRAAGVTEERARHEVLWVAPDGMVLGGARAVAELLRGAGGAWSALGTVLRLPPVRPLAHRVYRLVADNRHRLPGGTPACALPGATKS
ncbi:thiol-disulfide oxidoreductase DCC family protein [Streptomyces sp. NPDC015220]|uniref:thiol-disulfide oxidoreductase DCC family protein n=1 Tax=Streptomyces sp. NPDC015220 TaxID=3364947 RepID=UPI0036FFBF7E